MPSLDANALAASKGFTGWPVNHGARVALANTTARRERVWPARTSHLIGSPTILSAMDFSTTPTDTPTSDERLAEILANPGFGTHFTDHMVTIEWTPDASWHAARVTPYGPLTLDPATAVLHYAQETFEGMKAYRREDGSVWTFRPEENGARMERSSHRLALPVLPVDQFVAAVDELVRVDQRWVPDNSGDGGEKSLYLRPFMFASEAFLGVRPAQHVTFMVIASPAGAYFKGGVKPVTLWLSTDYTRAGRGGMGAAKTGGNYASSLVAQQEATSQGCDQVVFLDAQEGKYVEELGGMNLYFVHDDGTIVTPETGTILEGITRASIMELAGKLGHQVVERQFSIDEWREGLTSGRITEIFACGTAAVVTPVGALKSAAGDVPAPASTDLTMRIRKDLVDVQFGRAEDTFGWMHRVV
jgi:branched-chain amino acid aminotransferase